MFLDQRTRAVTAAIERAYSGERLLFLVDSETDAQKLIREFADDAPWAHTIRFGRGSIQFTSAPDEDTGYDWAFWETQSGEYRIVSWVEVKKNHDRAGTRCPSWEGCSYTENPKTVYAQKARDREDARFLAVFEAL